MNSSTLQIVDRSRVRGIEWVYSSTSNEKKVKIMCYCFILSNSFWQMKCRGSPDCLEFDWKHLLEL